MISQDPYTVGVQDILAAVKLVKDKAAELPIDVTKISIGGSSAGGHLALLTASAGETTFNCVVSVAGPTDLVLATSATTLFPVTSWIVKSVFGENLAFLRQQSPIYQTQRLLARRVLLLHSSYDNLVPVEHAKNFFIAAQSRFREFVELEFSNDPLPNGVPYLRPRPDQITHNLKQEAIDRFLNQSLGSKCY